MTMFASKTPRDLNHDPDPYVDQWGIDRNEDGDPAGYDFDVEFRHDPRPEFDHVQHNEPNPILIAFRDLGEKHGMAPDEVRNLARNWVRKATYYEHHMNISGRRATNAQRNHARRVLTRLACLTEGERA